MFLDFLRSKHKNENHVKIGVLNVSIQYIGIIAILYSDKRMHFKLNYLRFENPFVVFFCTMIVFISLNRMTAI